MEGVGCGCGTRGLLLISSTISLFLKKLATSTSFKPVYNLQVYKKFILHLQCSKFVTSSSVLAPLSSSFLSVLTLPFFAAKKIAGHPVAYTCMITLCAYILTLLFTGKVIRSTQNHSFPSNAPGVCSLHWHHHRAKPQRYSHTLYQQPPSRQLNHPAFMSAPRWAVFM